MRVITGSAKGRLLCFPRENQSRPTSDRIREALFNILASVQKKMFLDVYAGSGSVGIEALSRGAFLSVFIEKDMQLCNCIRKNLRQCEFSDRSIIMDHDVKRALGLIKTQGNRFDVVFADPPYSEYLVQQTVNDFADGTLLTTDGILVLQHSTREIIDEQGKAFHIIDQRKIGDTMLTFIKYQEM